jgi:hypothetical protein
MCRSCGDTEIRDSPGCPWRTLWGESLTTQNSQTGRSLRDRPVIAVFTAQHRRATYQAAPRHTRRYLGTGMRPFGTENDPCDRSRVSTRIGNRGRRVCFGRIHPSSYHSLEVGLQSKPRRLIVRRLPMVRAHWCLGWIWLGGFGTYRITCDVR